MSWDIYIQDFPATAKRVADIPSDFQARPLGRRSQLIAQIRDLVPSVNFSNPEWGVFEAEAFSIEFSMGADDICNSITLLVRGGGRPAPFIAGLLDRLRLRGIDSQTGEFFNMEAAKASFATWQQYRNQISAERKEPDGNQ
jgi:hypothetical protein